MGKKQRKFLFVNPRTKNTGLSSSRFLRVPPLNLRILQKYTQNIDPKIQVYIVDEFKESIDPYLDQSIDFVGITAMTPAASRAYEIARMFKRRGVKTIIGGIHATVRPEEAENYVDCVVTGEVGPEQWQQILSDFEQGKLRPRYDVGLLNDMTQIPMVETLNGYIIPFTTQTARGCPLACDFCSVSAVNGRIVRTRPIKAVIAELKKAREDGAKNFIFVDDNICPLGEENTRRSIELFKEMAKADLGMKWGSQTGVNFGNNKEALFWARKCGCKAVFVGFESLSEATLRERNKIPNIKQFKNLKELTENFAESIERMHEFGIAVLGGFIFGNDTDDEGIFERTKEFVFKTKLDGAQYTILTPLPGTKLFQRYEQEGRLLYTNYPEDWEKYDVQTLVFKPKNITTDRFVREMRNLYKDTNSLFPSVGRAWSTLLTTHNPFFTCGMMLTNLGYLKQANNLLNNTNL